MKNHTSSQSRGLDIDSEICLVSAAGLIGAGALTASLGSFMAAAVFIVFGVCVGMTTAAARAILKRQNQGL